MDQDLQKIVNEAQTVEALINSNPTGLSVLFDYYKKYLEDAFRDLKNVNLPDDTLKYRQLLYNEIERWVDLPNAIIQMGHNAIESTKDGTYNKRPVKEAVL